MFSAQRVTPAGVLALAAALSWTEPSIAAGPSVLMLPSGIAALPAVVSPASGQMPAAVGYDIVRRNPFGSKPMSTDALASRRGGDGVFNENQLKGLVADNRASNLTTGTNVISDGAFSGSVGLPMIIQNSGNNVLIQNATIVNVQLK